MNCVSKMKSCGYFREYFARFHVELQGVPHEKYIQDMVCSDSQRTGCDHKQAQTLLKICASRNFGRIIWFWCQAIFTPHNHESSPKNTHTFEGMGLGKRGTESYCTRTSCCYRSANMFWVTYVSNLRCRSTHGLNFRLKGRWLCAVQNTFEWQIFSLKTIFETFTIFAHMATQLLGWPSCSASLLPRCHEAVPDAKTWIYSA